MRNGRHTIHIAVFGTALAIATAAALELGALALFHLLPGRFPDRGELRRSLAAAPAEPSARSARVESGKLLHPYFGYVRNPEATERVNALIVDEPVNELGFFGPSPLAPRREDGIRVALTGGSVAEELYLYGRERLERDLESSGAFGDGEVEIVSVALAGFKQPQQLMAISYLLVLGAPLDVVINLDGFNEVVLPFTDNVPLQVAPSYPYRWRSVAASRVETDSALLLADLTESRRGLETWRTRFRRLSLEHSAAALALWHAIEEHYGARTAALETELRERLSAERDPGHQVRGPPPRSDSPEALFAESAAVWKRASLQLASLCRSHGVAYFHFLQPSQYVAGSKRFTPEERGIAILPTGHATRVGAEAGYPRLLRAGEELRASGVPFFDLTGVFSRETEPIYRDGCCHFFARGYQIVARAVARSVVDGLQHSPELDYASAAAQAPR